MAHLDIDFISYTLERAVHLVAIIPTAAATDLGDYRGYRDIPPLPVVYLLHGYLNNENTWGQYTSVERYAEERRIAVIMLAGENSGYLNSEKLKFYDFIEEELIPFCEHMFPISQRVEDRYIAGLSMGGFGAGLHAFSHPEKFTAVGLFSPVLCKNPWDPKGDTPLSLLKGLVKKGIPYPQVYYAIGDQDFLMKDHNRFMKYIKANKVRIRHELYKGYAHEWGLWDILIRKFLDFIPRTDYYAGKIRKI